MQDSVVKHCSHLSPKGDLVTGPELVRDRHCFMDKDAGDRGPGTAWAYKHSGDALKASLRDHSCYIQSEGLKIQKGNGRG